MLVVEELMLKEGMNFDRVYYEGSKKDLKMAIDHCEIITFTFAPEGHTKELNVAGDSIMCYETEVDEEQALGFDPSLFEGAQIFMFPTAGFSQQQAVKKDGPTEKLLHDLFGQNIQIKKPPFGL